MSQYGFKPRPKTIIEQAAAIKSRYKGFSVTVGRQKLKATGVLQPTARSVPYKVEIIYTWNEKPIISVLDPPLVESTKGEAIPHIYPGKKLCLYQPKYGEFTPKDLLSETILPWTSLWLYYYEYWHATGEWLGGGEHPDHKTVL